MKPNVPGQVEGETQVPPQQGGELPAFPIESPQSIEEPVYQPVPQETYVPPQAETSTVPQNTEIQPQPAVEVENTIPKSSTPEMHTPVERVTSKEGELAFQNVELGQATFKGGVTTQQLVSKISGYYTVNQGLVNDPHSGLLQQTASSGDPTQATTWQATMLYKILQAFWKSFGL